MKQKEPAMSTPARAFIKDAAASRIIELYQAWNKPDKLAEWSEKLKPGAAEPQASR